LSIEYADSKPKPYRPYKQPQVYRPVDPSIANIILEYRDDLVKVQLKIVEFLVVRAVRKKSRWSCTKHGHEFDVHEAVCPKCVKAEKQKWAEIELRNKHLESVVKSILGDTEI
jgi:lipopolysaccharide biosynthesis regulator YciM